MVSVKCVVEEIDMLNLRDGRDVKGVQATCPKCGLVTESYGTGPKSIARCLILLRQGCESGEENYYAQLKDDDDKPVADGGEREVRSSHGGDSSSGLDDDEWAKRTGRR